MGKLPGTQRPHRQRFSKEFKLAAIELLKAGLKPGTQITLELGISLKQLKIPYKYRSNRR